MENQKGGLKFDDALKFVQPRPWLVDDLGNPKTYRTNDMFVIKIVGTKNFLANVTMTIYIE